MTLGSTPRQADIFRSTAEFCEPRVAPDSIYALLHQECFNLFPDALFGDLFTDVGRRSIPPLIVAVVMVLQRLEGCSDREAVERFTYDARWKYAAGGLPFDYPGFAHTVLVDMRARLARSARPRRIFEVTLAVAREAGLVGARRVLDSTPLYDAVATMDTVTLVRSAIRGLLALADEREDELRALLRRDDDYRTAGKPACEWDDPAAREALVDALARDGTALLGALDGERLAAPLGEGAALLATILGQDLDQDADGVFRIARRVAPDRIISTVDPETRHGHKTSARGFDGYKGHVAIDPDAELITATTVTAGNVGDAAAAAELLAAELAAPAPEPEPAISPSATEPTTTTAEAAPEPEPLTVYGDAAYGAGELLATLDAAGATAMCKVQPPVAPGGRFSKADFGIDLGARTVTCPAGRVAPLRPAGRGAIAAFGRACAGCPLAERCTTSATGRTISVGPFEAHLARARAVQRDPAWSAAYRATRPKVERKIGHLMRRRHGGRRARVRGRVRVGADFALLGAAVNLARLAVLGLVRSGPTWAIRVT
jgi:hypothetical protein